MKFDSIFYNGKIISMNPNEDVYDWIAVKGGKVAALGRGNYDGDAKTLYNLNGKSIIPGLSDCHCHVMMAGIMLKSVMLDSCTCLEDVFAKLEERCLSEPGDGYVYGFSFLDQNIKEKRYPTKQELDKISHGHKIIVFAATMHANAYNSAVDRLAAVPKDLPGVDLDENGETTGRYLSDESVFYAQNNIFGSFTDDEIWEYVKICAEHAATQGATSIHGLFGQFVEGDRDVDVVIKRKNSLPIDLTIYHQTWHPEEAAERGMPRVGGCLTLDGSAFEHTMANYEPYVDRPGLRGVLYHTDNEVYEFISKAHSMNMQCTMHAVGERSIDQLLYTYLRVFTEQGRKDIRHRLEHFCLPTDEQIKMAKELDIILSMQPSFSYYWDGSSPGFDMVLGRERADRLDPLKKVVEAGITVIGGSDSPVAPIQPLKYVEHCINGYNKIRNISVTDALKIHTLNAAYANYEEDVKGSLEIGKCADMVIISDNLFKYAKSDDIFNIEVVATIKNGHIIYENRTYQ